MSHHGRAKPTAFPRRRADEGDEEQTLDRRRSLEPNAQPSTQDHEAAEALAFNRKPPGGSMVRARVQVRANLKIYIPSFCHAVT